MSLLNNTGIYQNVESYKNTDTESNWKKYPPILHIFRKAVVSLFHCFGKHLMIKRVILPGRVSKWKLQLRGKRKKSMFDISTDHRAKITKQSGRERQKTSVSFSEKCNRHWPDVLHCFLRFGQPAWDNHKQEPNCSLQLCIKTYFSFALSTTDTNNGASLATRNCNPISLGRMFSLLFEINENCMQMSATLSSFKSRRTK